MWYHFQFASGANPYISKTEADAKKNIARWKRKGYIVEKLDEGFYVVYDVDSQNVERW